MQCFSCEKVLQEHKETFLKINDKQSVKLRGESINFKNFFEQLAVPFKNYADFEYLLKGLQTNVRNNITLYTEKNKKHVPCSFAYRCSQ